MRDGFADVGVEVDVDVDVDVVDANLAVNLVVNNKARPVESPAA
jgi:hypothetical protein